MSSDSTSPAEPSSVEPSSVADGRPRPDPDLPPPAQESTPVPAVPEGDELARQTAATIRSVSRLEEAN